MCANLLAYISICACGSVYQHNVFGIFFAKFAGVGYIKYIVAFAARAERAHQHSAPAVELASAAFISHFFDLCIARKQCTVYKVLVFVVSVQIVLQSGQDAARDVGNFFYACARVAWRRSACIKAVQHAIVSACINHMRAAFDCVCKVAVVFAFVEPARGLAYQRQARVYDVAQRLAAHGIDLLLAEVYIGSFG